MVNKKIVCCAAIISIIVVISGIIAMIYSEKKTNFTISNEIIENVEKSLNNTTNSTEDETITEQNIVDEIQDNVEENTVVQESNDKELKQTNEEKARELVKEEWGEDDTVYFKREKNNENENSDTVFFFSVRNSDTSATLAIYKVDLETEKVEEY